MSVYTSVSQQELTHFLQAYPVGELLHFSGISAGVENTNYFVTTTQGEFVLTLFEHHHADELSYFLALMQHWSAAGIPVAHPITTHTGQVLGTLKHKPAALIERLSGIHIDHPSLTHCAAIGRTLAQMHLSGRQFAQHRSPDRGQSWRLHMAQQLLTHPQLQQQVYERQLLQTELAYQQTIPYTQLPSGTIHADLFRDNALFVDDKLSGVLDMYYACEDNWLYDLAIVVHDWCGHPDGSLDNSRVYACIQAYQHIRPWEAIETQYWQATLRAAALRFWLSRLNDQLNPREGEMALQKDPNEFRDKLAQLQQDSADSTIQEITLDARRLLCPMPVIRTQQAIADLPVGSKLTVICTDPGVMHDIPAWARLHGHQVEEAYQQDNEYIIVIRTGSN